MPAVILAGGQARRMDGRDKALLVLAGRPLLSHVAGRLARGDAPLAISANGDPDRFAACGLAAGTVVLPDAPPAGVELFPGPLAGLLAGMDWAAGLGRAHVVTAAADTPFLPSDLVARLWAAGGQGGPAVAATPDAEGRVRRHPTAGLWPVALRDQLRAALAEGERKLGRWADRQGAAIAVFPVADVDPFFNINTPADLIRAEALLAQGAATAP